MIDSESRQLKRPSCSIAPVVIHSERSAPMHALLSLANAESHNFTAEVLMREAAETGT